MSKTKTKRVVASFLLLCLMSGSKVLADDYKGPFRLINSDSTETSFDIKTVDGYGGPNQGAITNFYSNKNVTLNSVDGAVQQYINNFQAGDAGGAIYNGAYNDTQTVTINGDSSFINNAGGRGGAVYNEGTIVFGGNTKFDSNSSTSNAESFYGGGAILNFDGDISFGTDTGNNTVSFTNNESAGSGGAIFNLQTIEGRTPSVDLSKVDSTFSGNTAAKLGGAIYSGQNSTVTLGNAEFSSNKDKNGNNDIYLDGNAGLSITNGANVSVGSGIAGSSGAKITNSGNLTLANGSKNSSYIGTYEQNAGQTTVESGTTFFGGNSTISNGDLILKAENALVDGSKITLKADPTDNYDEVNVYINADNTINGNVTGLGYIYNGNKPTNPSQDGRPVNSTATITLTGDNSGFKGTYYQDSDTDKDVKGKLIVAEGATSFAGTTTITGSAIELQTNSTLLATTMVTNGDFDSNGATIAGTVDFFGPDGTADIISTNINNVIKVHNGSEITISGDSTLGENGQLAFNGGTINVNQDFTINDGDISVPKELVLNQSSTLAQTGDYKLTINTDVSSFEGTLDKNGGSIDVNGQKFFGGTNNIYGGAEVNLSNNAELVAGSTTNLGATDSGATTSANMYVDNSTVNGDIVANTDSQINLSNGSTVNGDITLNGTSDVNINKDSASDIALNGAITGAVDSTITLSQGNLTIRGNMSGFEGVFTQNNGKTTVLDGATFFGGTNDINAGTFIFNDGAQLASDININSHDIVLQIGDENKTLVGNKLVIDGGKGFVLNDALMEGADSVINTAGDFTGHVTFKDGAGLGSGANVELKQGQQDKYGWFTFSDASVAESGSKITMNNDTKVDIESDITFGTQITGNAGAVTVGNADPAKAPEVSFTADNSGFKGTYTQTNGDVTVSNQFFGGTNSINGGTLALVQGGALNGTTTFADGTEFSSVSGTINGVVTMKNGSEASLEQTIIADKYTLEQGSSLELLDGNLISENGYLDMQGGTVDINGNLMLGASDIKGSSGVVNSNANLTVDGDASSYSGEFNHSGTGEVTVNGGEFFAGKNNIKSGNIKLNNGSELVADSTTNLGATDSGAATSANMYVDNSTLRGDVIAYNDSNIYLDNDSVVSKAITLEGTSDVIINSVAAGKTGVQLNAAVNNNGTDNNITLAAGNLLIGYDQSAFTGDFIQNGGTATLNAGKFFGGKSTINNGNVIINTANALADGSSIVLNSANQDNYDDVNLYINADNTINGNVTGLGYIYSDKNVTLQGVNSEFTGSYHQENGGMLTVDIGATSFAGTNVITNAALKLNSGSTLQGTTIISTNADKTSTFVSNGAKITGTVDLFGTTVADMSNTKINNIYTVSGGTLDLNGGNTISNTGSLVVNAGTVNIEQVLTLGGDNNGIISGNGTLGQGSTGKITMNNTETLTILGDMSGYDGAFEKTDGKIVIGETTGSKDVIGDASNFFSGNTTLTNVEVDMNDNSQIVAEKGKTVTLNNTTVDIQNSGLTSYDVTEGGQVTVVSNDNKTVLGGNIAGDETSIIKVSGEDTFLQLTGDASDYKGAFSQESGTTQVMDGAVFFGGVKGGDGVEKNYITGGNLIFEQGSKLASDVVIANDDVSLAINGTTDLTITQGNKVAHDGGYFVLEEVTIKDTLLHGGEEEDPTLIYSSTEAGAQLSFAPNAGLAGDANYQLGNGEAGSGHYTFGNDSVAADGSTLKVTENSSLTVTANTMHDENGQSAGFDTKVSGGGSVVTNNTVVDKNAALNFSADNSGFTGKYEHNGGIIQFSGVSADDKAVFFGGTNDINAGTVIFAANSVVTGTNKVTNNANFELTDGSTIDDKDNNTVINLGSTGNLNITNTGANSAAPVKLNVSVIGSTIADEITGAVSAADINKTDAGALTISADQHTYTGNYTQTGTGTVTVAEGNSFFGGKNNINNGIVDLTAEGAKVAGQNTISEDGKILIGDKTDTTSYLKNPIIVNTVESDINAGLELATTNGNEQNLEVAFAIASGEQNTGRVTHSGDGTLNLNKAGESDLFADFKGTFAQTSTGITNVFGNSFAKNDIDAGILNLKDGSTLVAGTTDIAKDAILNIGTLENDTTVNPVEFTDDSKVTIASSISGEGTVNISQGTTTIKGTSDNSKLKGTYHQTGGEVIAEGGSTFFGALSNLIEKGKLLFKKGDDNTEAAKLANGVDVTLDGNTDLTGKTENTQAVLDLDGRTNAVFKGDNKLLIDGQDSQGFVFTDGVLQNAMLNGTQDIGADTVITLKDGSGFASGSDIAINAENVILGSGSQAQEGSNVTVNTLLTMVSDNLDFKSIADGTGAIRVEKDLRETNAPNINIYNDQSQFTGTYYQDAGRVTVKNGATFFAANDAKITGIKVENGTDAEGNTIIAKETSGDLYLEKGSLLGSAINVTNFDKSSTAGVSTPHGRVFIEDKIYDSEGNELTDINKLMDGDLWYNTSADGSIAKQNIRIENAGLILSNGTIFDGSQGPTVFENKGNGGVVDIGFSNGTGVDGDIVLKRDTMLSYGDNAYIKDDSTLEMEDTAILNFINDTADITYNPDIVGGGSIYKEGLATTNISSAIDMTGEVKVSEGTLNFTNKDNVIFKAGDDLRQSGDLTVGSASSNAAINIIAKETEFQGNVTTDAQDGTQSVLGLKGANTTIGGNLKTDNTNVSIFGNTTVGGDWNVNGNTALNLAGNYANTIDVAGDLILGADLKDGKLPVSFDYDPHRGAMDSILVDSFVNDNNSPLLITGINFVTSPVDRNFNLSADRLIQQRDPQDTPFYDPTSFYANTAMGRYYLSNGAAGGSDFMGTLVHLNPQQYRGQVATIASWQNQLLINNLLFDHMDIVTRQLMDDQKTANKYAASIPQFGPYQYDLKGGSLWYKAYGNFETLSMTKGLSVGNNAYGALIGADFPLIKLKHGWNVVPTAYIGYNGAHQHFNGVSMYQNGAQLGFMGTAYKGNFLTSLLAYGGGYGNDMSMSGQYGGGSDNTGNWFAGVASKSAYNIHLPADFILQPTVMAAYNAFGSQNWGSDFGVMSMSSGMLNGINVAPGVNLIWQKKSFNIYLTAQMVYNIMGGVDGRAGNVDLGYVRMRHSYFEYGLGVSKNFKDRFGGFLQFVIRNGGRTGIGFSGGLQIKLGK